MSTVPTDNRSTEQATSQASGQQGKWQKHNWYFLVGTLVLLTILFFNIVKIFVVPIVVAIVFVSLFYSFYEWVLKKLNNRSGISALFCCLLFLLGLLLPMLIVAGIVGKQAVDLYQDAESTIQKIVEDDREIIEDIQQTPVVRWVLSKQLNWKSWMHEGIKASGSVAVGIVNKTSRGIFDFITTVFILLFTMFYFFRDGKKSIQWLRRISPLDSQYEGELYARFVVISRATVKGTLLIGLTQGLLGAITLLVFGIDTWLLWGAVMVILSVIPVVGAWIVMIPASIIQLLHGHVWQGIGIFLVSTAIVSSVDNLMRPRLIGHGAGIHDLLIFFTTIGGISVFGVLGFIIGPVIAALLKTLLDIYATGMNMPVASSPSDDPEQANKTIDRRQRA